VRIRITTTVDKPSAYLRAGGSTPAHLLRASRSLPVLGVGNSHDYDDFLCKFGYENNGSHYSNYHGWIKFMCESFNVHHMDITRYTMRWNLMQYVMQDSIIYDGYDISMAFMTANTVQFPSIAMSPSAALFLILRNTQQLFGYRGGVVLFSQGSRDSYKMLLWRSINDNGMFHYLRWIRMSTRWWEIYSFALELSTSEIDVEWARLRRFKLLAESYGLHTICTANDCIHEYMLTLITFTGWVSCNCGRNDLLPPCRLGQQEFFDAVSCTAKTNLSTKVSWSPASHLTAPHLIGHLATSGFQFSVANTNQQIPARNINYLARSSFHPGEMRRIFMELGYYLSLQLLLNQVMELVQLTIFVNGLQNYLLPFDPAWFSMACTNPRYCQLIECIGFKYFCIRTSRIHKYFGAC